MQKAIDDCRNGVLSVNLAAKVHNVPRSSLRDQLAGRSRMKLGEATRKFTDAEEGYLAEILLKCADLGVPLGKPMLKQLVAKMAVEKGLPGRTAVFTDKWHRGFLQRHPPLRLRVSHSKNRKKAREWTAETCEEWLTHLGELNHDGYFDDGTGVWNLDESAFQIAEKVRLVYARCGTKEVLSYMDGTDRDLITVLACGNASGEMLPPLVLFDGKLHVASRFEGTADRCYLAVNSSGIMDAPTFASYIRDVVIPAMKAKKNVIFVDGHSSHVLNLELIEICISCGIDIKIVVFPAGQTAELQPFDKSVFGPVKKYWRDYLRHVCASIASAVTKQSFAGHLMDNWSGFNLEKNLKSGFLRTGLFPYDPCVIARDFEPVIVVPAEEPARTVAELYAVEFKGIADIMRKIHPLTELGMKRSLEFILRQAEGFIPSIPANDIAQKLSEQVLEIHPQKKRQLKDTRLCTKAGAVMNWSSFIDGIRDREKEKTAKEKEKVKKRVPRHPQKRVPESILGDITNTPPKKRFRRGKE